MRVSTQLSVLLAAATTQVSAQDTGELGDAAEVTNNPVGVEYRATLPDSAFFKPAYPNGGNIKGWVKAVANEDGRGVRITLNLENLPKTGGPFSYHLHVAPVPENGNCTETLAHLDPYIRGEDTPCNDSAPATCQVGDLSGKHGKIPADEDDFEASYVDLYASTVEDIGAFFGNRSIVFHYPNKTRITCANFERVEGGADLPGGGDDDDNDDDHNDDGDNDDGNDNDDNDNDNDNDGDNNDNDGDDADDNDDDDNNNSPSSSTTAPPTGITAAPTNTEGAGSDPAETTGPTTAGAPALRASAAGAVVLGVVAAFLL
ncbi:superoxide dismutase [Corynascus novoguineensis]|uniref:superoxide dismutase n=1 Tax=Corynascus novoguineensis TaxID=1126955 RepID=A0AAN7D4D4_9PEZI|nr:superoxide dismutase [Corynascus novoguineensis]